MIKLNHEKIRHRIKHECAKCVYIQSQELIIQKWKKKRTIRYAHTLKQIFIMNHNRVKIASMKSIYHLQNVQEGLDPKLHNGLFLYDMEAQLVKPPM